MWQLARKWTACAAVLGTTTLALVLRRPGGGRQGETGARGQSRRTRQSGRPCESAAS